MVGGMATPLYKISLPLVALRTLRPLPAQSGGLEFVEI